MSVSTAHRVMEVAWLPRSSLQWETFSAARRASAALWSAMARIHARLRRGGGRWRWPTRARWERWAQGRFPGLSAQSVQQGVAEFCEAVASATAARARQARLGLEVTAAYPDARPLRHRDVTYTNQDATVRDGFLRLSHGRGHRPLRIRLPRALPGRLVEVRLSFGTVRCVCGVPEGGVPSPSGVVVGVDLGVNTLLAATDGERAVLVSGRALKAVQRYRNKRLASLQAKRASLVPGSRRHKRLQRRKRRHLDRCARQQRDIAHKATRILADAFPGAAAVAGRPFNDAARGVGRRQAQQVSQAVNRRLLAQLAYKLAALREVAEAYSSQTCPVCGRRQVCRRVYRCGGCGLVAPRDVVGSANIRAIGLHGELRPRQPVPVDVRYVRPLRKYPGGVARAAPPGSSGGTPACSSAAVAR